MLHLINLGEKQAEQLDQMECVYLSTGLIDPDYHEALHKIQREAFNLGISIRQDVVAYTGYRVAGTFHFEESADTTVCDDLKGIAYKLKNIQKPLDSVSAAIKWDTIECTEREVAEALEEFFNWANSQLYQAYLDKLSKHMNSHLEAGYSL